MKIGISGSSGFIGTALKAAAKISGSPCTFVDTQFDVLASHEWVSYFQKNTGLECFLHLAGISHVPTCEENSKLAIETNTLAVSSMLDAIRRTKTKTHVIFFSSAQVYDIQKVGSQKINESSPLGPQNFYGWTKLWAEGIIEQTCSICDIPYTILRLFNHSHKTQSPQFFLPHLYSQILSKKSNEDLSPILVGNLNLDRDIGSLQDLCKVLLKVIEKRPQGTFNICSGYKKNLRVLAESLARKMDYPIQFETDLKKLRPGEAASIIGDCSKLIQATGWHPTTSSEAELIDQFL
jgi:nucleoside-diphosphate-sugar epimerase